MGSSHNLLRSTRDIHRHPTQSMVAGNGHRWTQQYPIYCYVVMNDAIYIHISVYKCVFWSFDIFALPAAGLLSCSRFRGTQGARPTPHASLGPGQGLWHMLWGFKVARPFGEAFRACRAIQVPANPRTG